MRVTATHRLWASYLLLLVTALLALGATRASAQPATCPIDPLWDHYKLYYATPLTPPAGLPPVQLTDQWGLYQHDVLHLEYWMNPVEKTVFEGPPPGVERTYGITKPFLHYTWWRISPQYNEKLVAACNQFGDQTLYVKDAEYLLNPARKNQQGPPLPENHYKCYACEGQPVNKPVKLFDQFDQAGGYAGWNATVTYPRWFCNPTEKYVLGAEGYSLRVDPNQHYVCYEYTPPDTRTWSLGFSDQFLNYPIDAGPSRWLCVPTYKSGFTPNTRGTWGKLKTLYR